MTATVVGVYGTLKKNYSNHGFLEHSKYIGTKKINGFRLFQSGIPFAYPDKHSPYPLHVEVYEVDDHTLSDLDRLEGHPDGYTRTKIPVDDSHISIYVYNHYNVTTLKENTTGVF